MADEGKWFLASDEENEEYNKKGDNMYEKLLKKLEDLFAHAIMNNINEISIEYVNNLADLIVKIKTIQTLEVSCEMSKVALKEAKKDI